MAIRQPLVKSSSGTCADTELQGRRGMGTAQCEPVVRLTVLGTQVALRGELCNCNATRWVLGRSFLPRMLVSFRSGLS